MYLVDPRAPTIQFQQASMKGFPVAFFSFTEK